MDNWEKSLAYLLQSIDVKKELNEQLDVLKAFDNLSQEQFDDLTSGWYIKHEEAAIVMQYLPIEQFYDRIRLLLEHLEDRNWSASGRIAKLLVLINERALPEIRRIFQQGAPQAIWLVTIIEWVIFYWDDVLILQLKNELIEAVSYADAEGASIAALRTLRRVLTMDEFEPLYQQLRNRYSGNASLTDDLDYALEK